MSKIMEESAVLQENGLWKDSQGWWFSDETEDMNGPFETPEAAKEEERKYFFWLNGGTTDG